MENNNNGVGKKIQKNPFLLGLFVVVITVALFAISTLSTAIQERIREKEQQPSTTTGEIQTTAPQEVKPENAIEVGSVKKYVDGIENISCEKEANRVAVKVTFEDEEKLVAAHFANTIGEISVVPMFYFYVDNSAVQIKCPGEIRLLSDGKSVIYYLSEFTDYANAAGVADNVTITLDNLLTKKFNVCLEHKTREGVSKTILGTYGNSVEQFITLYGKEPIKVKNLANGIKRVEATVTDEFIWVDIYYTDLEAFTKLNNDLITNFIKFKLEKGGKFYESDFLITEYESINMMRCKFDTYSLDALAKEMDLQGKLTVKTLFESYDVSVFSSDYDTETALFTIDN